MQWLQMLPAKTGVHKAKGCRVMAISHMSNNRDEAHDPLKAETFVGTGSHCSATKSCCAKASPVPITSCLAASPVQLALLRCLEAYCQPVCAEALA